MSNSRPVPRNRPRRSNEPLAWALFSGGTFMSAMFLPIHVLLFGILLGFGVLAEDALTYDELSNLIKHPLTRIYLFFLISLSFFYASHKFIKLLSHAGLKRFLVLLSVVFYGGALLGTILTGLLVTGL